MTQKRKATFNLSEVTHQGLKLVSAIHNREMSELVDEAVGAYFKWNLLTKLEIDEIKIYQATETQGPGRKGYTSLTDLIKLLEHEAGGEVIVQLLAYLHNRNLIVEVNDGRTGYKNLDLYQDTAAALNSGQSYRLQLTIPGRLRLFQLLARQSWEEQWKATNPEFGAPKGSGAEG